MLEPKSMMKKFAMRTSRFSSKRGGFSLVEICLALGILAITLIPLLGMMAIGLGQVGSNVDNNQAVNISQQVFQEARQMQFSTLSGMGTYQRYFSNLGDVETAGNKDIVYTTKVTVTAYNNSAVAALPGGDLLQPTLVSLSVQVRKTPGGNDHASRPAVATFVGMISCEDLDYSGNPGI